MLSLVGKNRSFSGVELGIVFQIVDHLFHGIHSGTAVSKNLLPDRKRFAQVIAVGLLYRIGHILRYHPGPAVDRYRPVFLHRLFFIVEVGAAHHRCNDHNTENTGNPRG